MQTPAVHIRAPPVTSASRPCDAAGVELAANPCPLRVVSLGAYCGVRQSMKKVGCDPGETLPFDWMRTKVEGILHYMRNDFEGFFDYVTHSPIANSGGQVMFRDYLKSFWHHDPTDPDTREAFGRRFKRFQGIDATSLPVLFVRSVSKTAELAMTGELLDELTLRFGPRTMLLQLVDFQTKTNGPVLVSDRPNLLIWYVPPNAHSDPEGAPYGEPLRAALRWAQGDQIRATMTLPTADANKLLQIADVSDSWEIHGFRPFEEAPTPSTCPPSSFGSSGRSRGYVSSEAPTPQHPGMPFFKMNSPRPGSSQASTAASRASTPPFAAPPLGLRMPAVPGGSLQMRPRLNGQPGCVAGNPHAARPTGVCFGGVANGAHAPAVPLVAGPRQQPQLQLQQQQQQLLRQQQLQQQQHPHPLAAGVAATPMPPRPGHGVRGIPAIPVAAVAGSGVQAAAPPRASVVYRGHKTQHPAVIGVDAQPQMLLPPNHQLMALPVRR
eukprot:TRINITY_DN2949_c1_g2_i1.p1 TRINITY_DN2949_c1_g2~~TRINITY_DN2949_c1_g2_i1.p1  ORF type:complete len:519 (+),score=89.89 TRINITY_DN2949_c1_g2_i1:76-1557(+)